MNVFISYLNFGRTNKLMKTITAILFFLLLFNFNVDGLTDYSIDKSIKEFEFRRIEIVDSSVCVVLDSIIGYEKFCHKRKNRLITYYAVSSGYILDNAGNMIFTFNAMSMYDNFEYRNSDTTRKIGVLPYKGRYFIFRDFSKIYGIEHYLRLTSNVESICIKERKTSNLGKTTSSITVEVANNYIRIYSCSCYCYYGNLIGASNFFRFRKFIYDLFCPCRGGNVM